MSTGVFEQRITSQITLWELGSPSARPETTLPTAHGTNPPSQPLVQSWATRKYWQMIKSVYSSSR